MKVSSDFESIASLRDSYRKEMDCQIVHDSLHRRGDWVQSFILITGLGQIGYGSILSGGPWQGTRTVFEFYLIPSERHRTFEHFEAFLSESEATSVTVQTNDPILLPLFHAFTENFACEKILFKDAISTSRTCEGITFRAIEEADEPTLFEHKHEPVGDWVLAKGSEIVGTGGFMTHYNPPYADIYMEIAEPHRLKGYGTLLVQELKAICYHSGRIPCCRCGSENDGSIKTIQRSGFVTCAHILTGSIKSPS